MTKKDLIEISKQITLLASCVDCIKSNVVTTWMNDYDNLNGNVPENLKSVYNKLWNIVGDLGAQIDRLDAYVNINIFLDILHD